MISKIEERSVKCRLQSLGKEDTEIIRTIWERVGRSDFTFPDIMDIVPNSGYMRKMSAKSVFIRTGFELRKTIWKINPCICARFELMR